MCLNDYLYNILSESINQRYQELNSLQIGDKVKDFTYYALDGENVSLSSFKGKWVLLDFWFVGCVPCHKAIPELRHLQNKFENCLEIVGINPIDKTERIKAYKEKNNISWNIVSANHDSNIKSYFNVNQYPTYILIDPKGNFRLIPNDFKIEDITKEISKIINSECKE